jgi:hypothetical protein
MRPACHGGKSRACASLGNRGDARRKRRSARAGYCGRCHAVKRVDQQQAFRRACNRNIVRVLRLSRDMMLLADQGDQSRADYSCGVLYGTLRDSAYKLRQLAELEMQLHKDSGLWDIKEQSLG